jgi:hypothetical protein
MTTDGFSGSGWTFARNCALAVSIWFGALAVAAWAFEPTQSVIVIAPGKDAAIASAAAADVALLDASAGLITVAGLSRGFVRELYAGGAWLVLPASSGGCRVSPNKRAGLVG